MRTANLAHLVLSNLAERKARTLTAVAVIAFAVAVVMVIGGLALGFVRGAVEKAEQAFPPTLLLVKPKALNVSILSFSAGRLDDAAVERIRVLPGVQFTAPQTSLRMPLHATGEIMGQTAATDAVMVGVDPAVVQPDVNPRFKFAYDAQTSLPIPCVVPRYFLDMYNLAYADSMGLPKINESFAMGKEFTLHLGSSFLMGDTGNSTGRKAELPCRIVGLTANPSLFTGVLIPLGHAREMNRWYTGNDAQNYNALHVRVGDIARVDDVTSRILDMGLTVESHRETLQKFQFIARTATLVTSLFAGVVVAIAAASIFNTFSLIMTQRRGEVGLLRAVGGTRRTVTALFVLEVAVIGLVGGVIGAFGSAAVLRVADARIVALLPRVSFLPEHLFRLSPWLTLACIAGAVVLCVLATLPLIVRTTMAPPAGLVSEG